MPWELIDIGHDLRRFPLPSRSAHSPTLSDSRAGHRPLERTKHQLLAHDAIEARPPEAKGLVEHRRHVGHIGYEVAIALDDARHLRQQSFVSLLLR